MIWLLQTVDVTTIAAVAVTMAADAVTTVDVAMEPVFLAEVPATAFSGASFFCAAAAITDVTTAVDSEAMTAVGSLSSCFSSAETATDAAVTDAAAVADAESSLNQNLYRQTKSRGLFPLPLSVFFCFTRFFPLHSLFFIFQAFQIQLIKSISIQHDFFFFIFHFYFPFRLFLPFILCHSMPLRHNLKTKSISSYKKRSLILWKRK